MYVILYRAKASDAYKAHEWTAVIQLPFPPFTFEQAANLAAQLMAAQPHYEFFMVPALLWNDRETRELTRQQTEQAARDNAPKTIDLDSIGLSHLAAGK